MALNKSSLLIRDYENIRQILRDIYIFGCFTRDDFVEMGISGRKYDNEQRRINAYLPNKFIQKRRVNKKVLQYCRYNMADSSNNYLADTYRNKSFTMLDIMSYFYVVLIMGEHDELTLGEILDAMPIYNYEVEFTKDNIRLKLEELQENGIVISVKEGRNVKYSLSQDIWKNFKDEELEDIYQYLDFVKCVSPFEIPYYFLQKKLQLYLHINRGIDIQEKSVFQFKQNHLFNSIDNDILLVILQAVKKHRSIKIKCLSNPHTIECITIPIKIIHDSTYGRQYLLCFNSESEKVNVIRLDRITDAKCYHLLSKDELEYVDKYADIDSNCWCTSGVDAEPIEVRVEFRFDEEKEDFILQRLKREGHGGKVEKLCDGSFLFIVNISDPDEMIPWIRSFGERAKVLSSGPNCIEKKIAADWEKAVKKYEAF